ncbi:MAG: exodeoxyribonuclease VII large subunit [Oscillospiraceae bacterium]
MAKVISVTALNKYVKSLLEGNPLLADIAIRGEISNFTKHFKTGHCYFSLKDETASVKAVMFRSDAEHLAFEPENGMRVMARCRVSMYERDGAFQIYVRDIYPDGIGAAQMAFEQLKQKLLKEGLFAEERKRPLPAFPVCVGLVTSRTGAALQDILKVAARRNPMARFLLAPVSVQGQAAAPEVAKGIADLDKSGRVDVIIVARGGGSAEDLWAFNDEGIARAAFASNTPIVSGIGHEIDYTILDFVADHRAPTPSAAAEMVLPDMGHVMQNMKYLYGSVQTAVQRRVDSCYNAVNAIKMQPAFLQLPALPQLLQQRVEQLSLQATAAAQKKVKTGREALQSQARVAAGLDPYAVLGRGYGMVYAQKQAVASVSQVQQGQEITVRMKDGDLGCTVNTIESKAGALDA